MVTDSRADLSTFLQRSQRSPGTDHTPEKFENATITGQLDLCLRKNRLGDFIIVMSTFSKSSIFKMASIRIKAQSRRFQ